MSRATSQLVGVEIGGSTGGTVGPGLGRKLAQRVLRRFKLARPVLVVAELIEQPARNPVGRVASFAMAASSVRVIGEL